MTGWLDSGAQGQVAPGGTAVDGGRRGCDAGAEGHGPGLRRGSLLTPVAGPWASRLATARGSGARCAGLGTGREEQTGGLRPPVRSALDAAPPHPHGSCDSGEAAARLTWQPVVPASLQVQRRQVEGPGARRHEEPLGQRPVHQLPPHLQLGRPRQKAPHHRVQAAWKTPRVMASLLPAPEDTWPRAARQACP